MAGDGEVLTGVPPTIEPSEAPAAPKPEGLTATPAVESTPAPTTLSWPAILLRLEEVLTRTRTRGGMYRSLAEAKKFVTWLEERKYEPDKHPPFDTLMLEWRTYLRISPTGKLTINQGLASKAAQLILIEEDNMRHNRPLPAKQAAPQQQPPPLEADDEDEGRDEEEYDEDEGPETEADAVPPSQRKAPRAAAPVQAAPPPPPVYAAPPPMYPPAPGYPPYPYPYPQPPKNRGGKPQSTNPNGPTYRPPGPAPGGALSKLIPQGMREKVRVFHRIAGGKREFVGDYTTQEINGSLEKFIHEFVDPDLGDQSAYENTYDIYEVGPDDKERGQPATITVKNREVQQMNPNDPLAQARGALELLQDVRAMDAERHENSQALLDEFKKKAVGGGDMNSMMMLMMMERFMGGSGGGNTEAIVLKVLEKLGAGSSNVPTLPLPVPPPAGSSVLDKVMESLAASALRPPPAPKTLMEQMTELKLLREIFTPSAPTSAVPPELISVLSKMNEKLDRPRGGIEEALGTFDKLTGVVKQLAPQVNMGGITGAIQSIMTPELGRALGNMLAQGVSKAQEAAGVPGAKGAPAATPNAQPTQPVQATPNAKPGEPPKEIVEAINAFRTETDETKAREKLLFALFNMYNTMPEMKARLDPVLADVLAQKFDSARVAVKEILLAAGRPDLDKLVFIDRTIAQLIVNAGGTPPKELLHEAEVVQLHPEQGGQPPVPYAIPTVEESEAKEKAEKAERERVKAAANGGKTSPANGTPPADVTKFEKPAAVQPAATAAATQPSNIA